MTDRFESILDESISALQAGVPLEEVLAEAPEFAAELRPMLYAAMLLADPNPALVPEERKARLKAEYMAQVADLPPVHPALAARLRAGLSVVKKRLTPKMVLNDVITVTITIVLTLVMAVLVLSYSAGSAIPGDFLYGIKLITEQSRLALTFDEANRQELVSSFNQRRLAEIEQLIQQERAAVIRFAGVLETRGENLWVIEGLPVFISNDAEIDFDLQAGDEVRVVGLLRSNGVLVADTILHQY